MPLQTPTTLAAAQMADAAINARSHYAAAASQLDSINRTILSMPNDQLAEFGNTLGPVEMELLTSSHAAQGDGLNQLIGGINAVLSASGIPAVNAAVDTRPLADKLAEQRREIVLADGVFSVVDFAPEPEPEPEPAPVAES
jgi:hypothetical protein